MVNDKCGARQRVEIQRNLETLREPSCPRAFVAKLTGITIQPRRHKVTKLHEG